MFSIGATDISTGDSTGALLLFSRIAQ